MSENWEGCPVETGIVMELKGNQVIYNDGVCLNMNKMFSQPLSYSTKRVLTFQTKDQATEYYYKMRDNDGNSK